MTCQTSQLINKVLHEMHACSKRMIKEIPNDSPRVWILWIRVPKHRKPLGIYFIKLTSSYLKKKTFGGKFPYLDTRIQIRVLTNQNTRSTLVIL